MDRQIKLAGCFNFRDLGGYPAADGRVVRWRRVFRSDGLHLLTGDDVARLRHELGLGCVVDLRSTAELRAEGRGLLEAQAMRFHHIPLFDGETRGTMQRSPDLKLGDMYFGLAMMATGPIARVVHVLAESECPAVYHCAAGKDRTGVVSAILLGLLGVPDGVIVADYAATRENIDAIVDRLMSLDGYRTMLSHLPPDTMHAEPETMIAFLDRIRAMYGSMEGYALQAGVAPDTLARLRDALLAPAP